MYQKFYLGIPLGITDGSLLDMKGTDGIDDMVGPADALGVTLGKLLGIGVGLGLSDGSRMGYQRASGLVWERPLAKICQRAF